MSGSSLARCLLVEGREQSTATQFWMRPSSLALLAPGWGSEREKWAEKVGGRVVSRPGALCAGGASKRLWWPTGYCFCLPGHGCRVDVRVSVMMRKHWIWHVGGGEEGEKGGGHTCTYLDYITKTKWSAWVKSISLSHLGQTKTPPSDYHTSVISLACFFWLIKMSSQWVSGLHISHNAAGYCTRIINKLFVMPQIVLMQLKLWKKKKNQTPEWKIGCWIEW